MNEFLNGMEFQCNVATKNASLNVSRDSFTLTVDAQIELAMPKIPKSVTGKAFFLQVTPETPSSVIPDLTDQEVFADWKQAILECGTLEGIDTSDDNEYLVYTVSVPRAGGDTDEG